jgi:hypothetical protein
MKTMSFIACLLAFFAMVGIAVADDAKPVPPVDGALPAVPDTPAAVKDIVHARQFTLDEGYPYCWFNAATKEGSHEQLKVSSGWLLVLKVDPKFVVPRQMAEPVLYVGDKTAERLNIGYRSGHVVAIVPGDVDLKKTPIYFGTPDLPERITADKAKAELTNALAAKIKPFPKERVEAATNRGGDAQSFKNKTALLRQVAELLKQYSPLEKSLIACFAPAEVKPEPEPKPAADNEE